MCKAYFHVVHMSSGGGGKYYISNSIDIVIMCADNAIQRSSASFWVGHIVSRRLRCDLRKRSDPRKLHQRSNSSSQVHIHGRQDGLSLAASLQAFESAVGPVEAALDGCLIAKNFIQIIAIREDVPTNINFRGAQLC